MTGEASQIKVKEHVVVQKFEGNPEDGRLVETITLEDGLIVHRELHMESEEK